MWSCLFYALFNFGWISVYLDHPFFQRSMKTFLRFSIVCLVIVTTVFTLSACRKTPVKEKTFVELNGKLHVKGTQLINEHGDVVVLRGVSLGLHNFYPRLYNDSCVKWLAQDWKCSVVRAAMAVDEEQTYKPGMKFSRSGTEGLDPEYPYIPNPGYAIWNITKVADAAIRYGVYVIIDFHCNKIHLEDAKMFFTEIATKYKGIPNVMYEIINEPDETYTWPEVKAYSEEVIRAIHSIDPEKVILVGSSHLDQDLQAVADNPIGDQSNILYTMHFKAGFPKKDLRDRVASAMAKGLPVFVSECGGTDVTGSAPVDKAEWSAYLNWMEDRKISWVAWSLSDNDDNCSMLKPEASLNVLWPDSLIREWGKICKTAIKTKNMETLKHAAENQTK